MKRVWFVTRKFPPCIGGMELLAAQVVDAFRDRQALRVISWSGSGRGWSPFFLLRAALQIAWGRLHEHISVLYLGDPVLAPLGRLVRSSGTPVVVTVHGLDVIYSNRFYQAYLRRFFWNRLDGYICHSRFVADLLSAGGIPQDRIHVIPLGVRTGGRDDAPAQVPSSGPMLLALGRLVPRKGVAWFVERVAPELFQRHPSATLVIAGDGPERPRILANIRRQGLAAHVRMCGTVSEALKIQLLDECDAVVMPNVPIAGDGEGFGLVALEAGAAGKAVFAADLEGLRDVVTSGENGWRLPAGDAGAWIEMLDHALRDRAQLSAAGHRARRYVCAHCDWATVGSRYADTITRHATA